MIILLKNQKDVIEFDNVELVMRLSIQYYYGNHTVDWIYFCYYILNIFFMSARLSLLRHK
jgi:hypothetical protein